jgi:high-affinity iron transporter
MLASFIIVFREVLEAGLIVGIVMAATVGIAHRGRFIAGGIAAGIAGACLVAAFVGVISQALAGNGQDVFNAGILCFAVLMLGWHNVWMAKHGREMSAEMKSLGRSVQDGDTSLMAMAVVVMIAILREGSEVVLFLYGVAASAHLSAASVFAGALGGIAAGGAVAWLLYRGLLAIPAHKLFKVTSWLIALLAAGMAGQAAALLANDDIIPAFGYQLWDTSNVVSTGSLLGRALQALVGYSDRPMGVQVMAYIATLGVLVTANRLINPPRPAPRATASAPQHR